MVFIGHLIKFIRIIVLASQVRQEMFVLGFTFISSFTFRVSGLGSRVLSMSWVPGLTHEIGHKFRVLGKVPGLGSHFLDMPKVIAYITC